MKQIFISAGVGLLCLTGSLSVCAKTYEVTPAHVINMKDVMSVTNQVDTLPTPIKNTEVGTAKPGTTTPVTAVIKSVPKARKVPVPMQVRVIKPVKIKVLKPKIIKPVIRLLN